MQRARQLRVGFGWSARLGGAAGWLALSAALALAQVTPAGPPQPAAAERTAPAAKPADVKLHDAVVFKVYLDHERESAAARARGASHALDLALDRGRADLK